MYQYTTLESHIYDLLISLSIRIPNQLTIDRIAEQLNIRVYDWEHSSEAVIYKGISRIFLQKQLSKEERWQTFGHELGHILLHSGSQLNLPVRFVEYQEWKADNFALHFCVPTFMLLQMNLPFKKSQAIYEVVSTFGVTPEFASRRLQHLENQYLGLLLDQNFAQTVYRGYQVSEKFENYE
ncbi:ImmA/IrrE family metallo-endopeptidase [Halobacillus naozhouensis]|uniref:ImmA/IrrE family metallo-endopeptidase n=1 Tax=Halobacillus naozhouensis TaxID=554880 RepID=A0ABY8J2B6_9BACI|nr:ImmA/IrrE family metallo-endopeptidase [Halobacillus naozhouensis]WFT74900.1 ImmA/IrrE family metallo-endopeptidase [Halobacillus naozhouensis]